MQVVVGWHGGRCKRQCTVACGCVCSEAKKIPCHDTLRGLSSLPVLSSFIPSCMCREVCLILGERE